MEILTKFKETAASVIPIAAIVLLLGLTIVPISIPTLIWFTVGSLLLTVGLTIFLMGVDMGITPVGERCGAALTAKRNLKLLLGASFVTGVVVTAAEPDIQVFATQVKEIFGWVNKGHFTYSIAAGVGMFMSLGLLRMLVNVPLKLVYLLFYLLLGIVAYFAPKAFIGIAFDSGGATTGPMTVPFIMALGLGASAVRNDKNASFGLTGVASVGPVLAVLLYSLATNGSSCDVAVDATTSHESAIGISGALIGHSFKEAGSSILPLLVMTFIAQVLLLKMTKRQMLRIIVGFLYAFIGLAVFLIGVNGGFMQAGAALGEILGKEAASSSLWYALMVAVGLVFGAIIVCAEPAVWVLSEQVEHVSDGLIRRKALLVFLSVGTAIAIALAMWRAVAGFNLAWILLPGYILALILMYFSPSLFTGIAFDSGGVASGPLTSSFVLSFTLGAASAGKGSNDSFGVIALVAMMPLIAIQIMGIIFEAKRKKTLADEERSGK